MSNFRQRLKQALQNSGKVKYKKGGYIKNAGGGDQVVYGARHSQGGVLRSPEIELEGGGYTPGGNARAGEVITTVYDDGGNPQEFYMSHKNGVAQQYLQAKAANGGTLPQQTKQQFAKLNESMNPDGSPTNVAANGGMKKYMMGGMDEYGQGGYTPHDMTNPKTGYTISPTTEGAHNSLKEAGFTHANGGMKKYFMGGAAFALDSDPNRDLKRENPRNQYTVGGFPAVVGSYLPTTPTSYLPSAPKVNLPMSGRGIPSSPFGSGSGIPQTWKPPSSNVPSTVKPKPNSSGSNWKIPNWMKKAGVFATAMLDTEGFEAGAVRTSDNQVVDQGGDFVSSGAVGGQIISNYFNGREQRQDTRGTITGVKGGWYYPDELYQYEGGDGTEDKTGDGTDKTGWDKKRLDFHIDMTNKEFQYDRESNSYIRPDVESEEPVSAQPVTPKGNDETRALQNDLINMGYDLPKYGADGFMGDETQGAIDQMNADKANAAAGLGVSESDVYWDPEYNDGKGQWLPKEGAANLEWGDTWDDTNKEWRNDATTVGEGTAVGPETEEGDPNKKAKVNEDDGKEGNFLDRIGLNNITDAIEIASILKANRYAQEQNKKIGDLKVESKKIRPKAFTPETVDLGDDKERTSQLTVANIKQGQESGKSMASIIAAQKEGQKELRSLSKTESNLQTKENNFAKKMNISNDLQAQGINVQTDRQDQIANNDAMASMFKNSIALSQNMRDAVSTKIKDMKQLKAAENEMLVINAAIGGGTGTDLRKGIPMIQQMMNKGSVESATGNALIENMKKMYKIETGEDYTDDKE